jgi:hypothetical protein
MKSLILFASIVLGLTVLVWLVGILRQVCQ